MGSMMGRDYTELSGECFRPMKEGESQGCVANPTQSQSARLNGAHSRCVGHPSEQKAQICENVWLRQLRSNQAKNGPSTYATKKPSEYITAEIHKSTLLAWLASSHAVGLSGEHCCALN